MRYSCVEPIKDIGWVVTGQQLMFSLTQIAEAALDWRGLQTEPLFVFNEPNVGLMKISNPEIPVSIRTEVESHLPQVDSAEAVCDDATVKPIKRPPSPDVAWRFRVEAHRNREFTTTLKFANGTPKYSPAKFDAMPPAKVLVLTP